MSLHYVLDGYNILKQVSYLVDKKIKEGRLGLIKMLQASTQLKKQAITIVFDGYDDSGGQIIREGFKVIFSANLSADDKIKNLVERSHDKRQIVVVTDDKEILFFVKALGANILKVADFIFWISGRQAQERNKSSQVQDDDKSLDYRQVLDINRELKKRWLKEP